jgi:hypothetical protein
MHWRLQSSPLLQVWYVVGFAFFVCFASSVHLVLAGEKPKLHSLHTVMDSGRRITGGGSEYAALLAHAEGVLYGMELGSVTLKRIGFFCFPIKHSTSQLINGPCASESFHVP